MIDFAIIRDGGRLLMPTKARGVKFSRNKGGALAAQAYFPMGLSPGLDILSKSGGLEAIISDQTAGTVWRGRVEDIGIDNDGVTVGAWGYQRLFAAPLYTALWSHSGSSGWREVVTDETPIDARPDRYQMDNNNRLYFAQQKGSNSSNAARGVMGYWLPDDSAKACAAISVDYNLIAFDSVEYALRVEGYTDTGTFVDGAQAVTSTTSSGTLSHTFGANVRIVTIQWYRNSATPKEYTGETGEEARAICTNIRIKTTTSATVLASAIAADLLSVANTLNSGHISTSAALVTVTTRDLLNILYEDARPSRILDDLARSHSYRWGVNDSGVFYFQPDTEGRTWYVQADDVQIRYSLRNYENEVYAKYRDANNRTLRTAVSRDAASALSTGWVVQGVINDQTTSSATAEAVRDAYLTDRSDYALMATATFSRLRDGANRYWSLWSIRPGDRIVINNLPAQSQYLPGLDSHVVGFVEYDHENGRLSYEPEVPVPTLVTLLAERQ